MKKVIVLSSSPRIGGNSDILCDQFIKGARDCGHKVEKIQIAQQNIKYCIGCMSCQHNGGVCVLSDDMKKLMDNMVEADIIVMATPVYFYTMSGQMKTFIDRTCPSYTKMKNKQFYIILTAAEEDKAIMQYTVDGFRAFFACLENPIEAGILYGLGVVEKGDITNHPSMLEAYEMGRNISN